VTALARHRLGASDVVVTELSLGCAALGNLFSPVDDATATATVDAAWSMGVRTFDTAPHYGLGLSERRLGTALRTRPRDEFVVSTKVGRLLEPLDPPHGPDTEGFAVPATHARRLDFSADGVRRSLEASLERLGLDRVDIALLHDPDDHVEEALRQAFPALARMRDEGMVGAIGAGMNEAATLARFVTDADIDVVLLAGRYTLLDRSGADTLLPAAVQRGVRVIVGGVFNSGLLADPSALNARFDYHVAPAALVDRARRLEAICAAYEVPLRAAAVRFPLRHAAVASVLIGARSPAEIVDAVELRGRALPPELWDALAVEEG
jgi:D-threo-aldose 1-dehydrogenase